MPLAMFRCLDLDLDFFPTVYFKKVYFLETLGSLELAMEEKELMLEWKGYSSSNTTFQNLYEDQDFTDVTLVCEDNARLEVHKVIVSSWGVL